MYNIATVFFLLPFLFLQNKTKYFYVKKYAKWMNTAPRINK